ncbi:MAG: hypothetical protein GC136_07680 [Alphaproteobacteria bacterium]|nr:hypothetical protein [Alphaproteobacteria bacterium]
MSTGKQGFSNASDPYAYTKHPDYVANAQVTIELRDIIQSALESIRNEMGESLDVAIPEMERGFDDSRYGAIASVSFRGGEGIVPLQINIRNGEVTPVMLLHVGTESGNIDIRDIDFKDRNREQASSIAVPLSCDGTPEGIAKAVSKYLGLSGHDAGVGRPYDASPIDAVVLDAFVQAFEGYEAPRISIPKFEA